MSPLGSTLGERANAYLVSAEDFKKHRKRLNKKMLKLRHELNIVSRDTKNYTDNLSSITSNDYAKDSKYADVLLFTAERDVLYAYEVKALLEVSGENAKSYNKLMVSKVKKASLHCKKLLSVVEAESDDLKKLEYFTYASLVQGFLSVVRKQWNLAINAYSIAKCCLDFQAGLNENNFNSGKIDDEEYQFVKNYTKETLDLAVDPSLNFALSQSDHMETTSDLQTITRHHCHDNLLPYLTPAVAIIKQKDDSFVTGVTVELIKSIKWRDYEATLYNDELAYKIMKINETSEHHIDSVDTYDLLVAGWTEILDIHTKDTSSTRDDDDTDKRQNQAILLTYINYNLLLTNAKKSLLMIEQITSSEDSYFAKYKDISRLYELVISNVDELKDLPGVYNDEDLYDTLENLGKLFSAKKTIILADSFALAGKYREALKIYKHVEQQLPETSGKFFKVEPLPFDVSSNADYRDFTTVLKGKIFERHAMAQFDHEVHAQTKDTHVLDNINNYPFYNKGFASITNVDKLGAVQPVLGKPVLFDIGYNYISYSTESSRTESTTQPAEDKKRGGLFGIFGKS